MEFDIKNNLLKSSIGDSRLGQKNVKTSIDQSLVATTEQKNLDLNMEKNLNEKTKADKEKKETSKKSNRLDLKFNSNESGTPDKKDTNKIVRDPLKLLKLL